MAKIMNRPIYLDFHSPDLDALILLILRLVIGNLWRLQVIIFRHLTSFSIKLVFPCLAYQSMHNPITIFQFLGQTVSEKFGSDRRRDSRVIL